MRNSILRPLKAAEFICRAVGKFGEHFLLGESVYVTFWQAVKLADD